MANYNLNQTGDQVQADLNLTENLQDAFSKSSTYAVDDIVIYDSKLYKCTTAVSTAGEWDSSKWTQIHLSDLGAGGGSGGTQLYKHIIQITSDYLLASNPFDVYGYLYATIINNRATQYSLADYGSGLLDDIIFHFGNYGGITLEQGIAIHQYSLGNTTIFTKKSNNVYTADISVTALNDTVTAL